MSKNVKLALKNKGEKGDDVRNKKSKSGHSSSTDDKGPSNIYEGFATTGGYKPGSSFLKYPSNPVMIAHSDKPESRMTTMEKMDVTNEGISKKNLEQLKEKAGLDYDQLVHILDVSRTTLIGKKPNERFTTGLSEKIMSLADIYSYGYEVFGDNKEFNAWIFQAIPALGGKAPFDILNNHYGRQEVRNLIGRIDYGVYS
ncbi:MAG: type II RES/Xre toxin-antitoxin system antitoxin [Flavisolibacter sp.]